MNKNIEIIDKIKNSTKNYFITGKAWTWKTTFIKLFVEDLVKNNINHVVLSPTWVAAINVWWVTIHSFFQFAPWIVVQDAWILWEKQIWNPKYISLKYIIIDEISMVRADLLDCLDIFLRKACENNLPFWWINMIFVWDLYQLSPIVTKKEYDFYKKYPSSYFFSSDVFLRDNFKLELIELKKVYRQTDMQFISILNNIRVGKISTEELIKINKALYHDITDKHIILTVTNKDQIAINSSKLAELEWDEFKYKKILSWKVENKDSNLVDVLILKKWARVMFLLNAENKSYVNWTLWTVTHLNKYEVNILTDEWKNIKITKDNWTEFIYEYVYDYKEKIIKKRVRWSISQLPIKLAWAITIHKSQWITYEKVSIDFWKKGCFADWQVYVALSRCKSFEWLHFKNPLDINTIKANKHITHFLENNIDSNNEIYFDTIWDIPDFEKEIYFSEKWWIDYFNVAKSIIKKINLEWWKAFIVWWFCRNIINWTCLKTDIDISTDLIPENIQKYFTVVNDIWKKFWVLVIKKHWFIYEITTFREDVNRKSIIFNNKFKEDANRRDFTINAIYLDPLRNEFQIFNNAVWKSEIIKWESIYDYVKKNWQNWISDLKNNIIRFIWNPIDRIKEDPIRLLRYIRFKYWLELTDYDPSQYEIVKNNFYLLKEVPFERIKVELEKIFIWKWVVQSIIQLKILWFFKLFINEIDNIDTCLWWEKYHLEWNVWDHIILIIQELYSKSITDPDMYWLALFHDIWKPTTYLKKENWNVSYIWHEKVSKDIFLKYAGKLKFTSKQIEKISFIIENHLLFGRIPEMKKIKARKLFLHPYWNDFFTFCSADNLGRLPRQEDMVKKINNMYHDFMSVYDESLLLNWDDIMKKYPELKWKEIWKKMREINDEIISNM